MTTQTTQTDHVHVVSYIVLPRVGGTPEGIADTLAEAQQIADALPAFLRPARLTAHCWHCQRDLDLGTVVED
jgi:hypothetical protein